MKIYSSLNFHSWTARTVWKYCDDVESSVFLRDEVMQWCTDPKPKPACCPRSKVIWVLLWLQTWVGSLCRIWRASFATTKAKETRFSQYYQDTVLQQGSIYKPNLTKAQVKRFLLISVASTNLLRKQLPLNSCTLGKGNIILTAVPSTEELYFHTSLEQLFYSKKFRNRVLTAEVRPHIGRMNT